MRRTGYSQARAEDRVEQKESKFQGRIIKRENKDEEDPRNMAKMKQQAAEETNEGAQLVRRCRDSPQFEVSGGRADNKCPLKKAAWQACHDLCPNPSVRPEWYVKEGSVISMVRSGGEVSS